MLHVDKVVSAKIDMFCSHVLKRQFFVVKIVYFSRGIVCLFYIGYKKCRFYVKLYVYT
jgi:hypothetical protein